MSKENTFPIVEVFGPTIQGEGVLAGHQTLFVRLGLCDYRCSWCDSLHAVDPVQVKANAVHLNKFEIIDRVIEVERQASRGGSYITPWITVSGGNPAIHKHFGEVVDLLHTYGYKVAVETQGTIMPEWMERVDLITVSPKPPSSGMTDKFDSELGQMQFKKYLELALTKEVVYKVVVFNDEDYEYAKRIKEITEDYGPFYLSVGNLVGDDNNMTLLEKYAWLVEKLLQDNTMANTIPLPQLHVLIWGNAQGV